MKRNIFLSVIFLLITVVTTYIFHTTQKGRINFYPARRLFVQGKYSQAIPYYEESIKFDKNNIAAYKELGFCYLWTKQNKEAINMFERTLQLKEDLSVKFALAQGYSWIKEYAKAISLMEEVSADNKYIKHKIALAEVYLWNSEPEKAIPIVKEALKEDPNNKKAKMILGKALYRAGESEKASEIFEELQGDSDE